MAYFTHYWKGQTASSHERDSVLTATGFSHTASANLCRAGVESGDVVYGITYSAGQLFVIGRMTVQKVVDQQEADVLLPSIDLWVAPDHAVAKRGSYTRPLMFDRVLPEREARRIRFVDSAGMPEAPFIGEDGRVYFQTYRNVRQITEPTAAMFDKVLGV